jgi:hypothetical protein
MLNRDTILAALGRLSERLGTRGVLGEINLLGGAAMVLGFKARQSTKDVDAIFAPAAIVREESRVVATELDLPEDWLNDAVKGFVSPRAEFRRLPDIDFPYLRVQVPTAEYMLAMKVMAARVGLGGGSGDKDDIRFLIQRLNLAAAEQVFEIVRRYYDPERVLPRSMYLVEEIFSEEAKP